MKIAVASDDYKTVSGHVGQCKGFIIYEIENGKIVDAQRRKNIFTQHAGGRGNQENRRRHTGGGSGRRDGQGGG